MLKVVKNFPAPFIGVVASVLLYVQQAVAGTASWEEAIPAAAGVVIAFFVTPSSRVSSNNYVIRPDERGYSDHYSLVGVVVVLVVVLILLRVFGVI